MSPLSPVAGRINTWANDLYIVRLISVDGPFQHFGIRRQDGAPCHSWPDFQALKNQLLGPETECAELYPAESRLVDIGNEYHLYACLDRSFRFPFGYRARAVRGEMR